MPVVRTSSDARKCSLPAGLPVVPAADQVEPDGDVAAAVREGEIARVAPAHLDVSRVVRGRADERLHLCARLVIHEVFTLLLRRVARAAIGLAPRRLRLVPVPVVDKVVFLVQKRGDALPRTRRASAPTGISRPPARESGFFRTAPRRSCLSLLPSASLFVSDVNPGSLGSSEVFLLSCFSQSIIFAMYVQDSCAKKRKSKIPSRRRSVEAFSQEKSRSPSGLAARGVWVWRGMLRVFAQGGRIRLPLRVQRFGERQRVKVPLELGADEVPGDAAEAAHVALRRGERPLHAGAQDRHVLRRDHGRSRSAWRAQTTPPARESQRASTMRPPQAAQRVSMAACPEKAMARSRKGSTAFVQSRSPVKGEVGQRAQKGVVQVRVRLVRLHDLLDDLRKGRGVAQAPRVLPQGIKRLVQQEGLDGQLAVSLLQGELPGGELCRGRGQRALGRCAPRAAAEIFPSSREKSVKIRSKSR